MKKATFTQQWYQAVSDNLIAEIRNTAPRAKVTFDGFMSYQVDYITGIQGKYAICEDSDTEEVVKIELTELGIDDLFGIVHTLRELK